MPKRKRSNEDELGSKLAEYQQELFRALKAAKGFERQRLSKRVHAEQANKIQRLNREITVLKSLDLQQTAQAHLSSSLVKFKAIAEHPSVPDEIKQGAPKPELSEEEKTALHNVTSGLYNRQNVREVIDKAIRGVCLTLEIPIPEKKGKKKKGEKETKHDSKEQINEEAEAEPETLASTSSTKRRRVEDGDHDDSESSESFKGFSDDDDDGTDGDEEDNSELDAEDEETTVERYASRLGGSDDSGSDEEDASALRAKYAALLGMRGDAPSEDDSDEEMDDLSFDMAELGEDDISGEDSGDFADVPAQTSGKTQQKPPKRQPLPSPSPPPPRKTKEAKAHKSDTAFLPTLMGGYFSGSESASDVDVAPRKKRLGQRQRQAIAERKHGEKANHMRKQSSQQKKGRDSGWDMRRGAVDPDDQGKGRQPWKKGMSNPLGGGGQNRREASGRRGGQQERKSERAKPRDDQGTLHPSWEARKKVKETQQAAFQGTKITF